MIKHAIKNKGFALIFSLGVLAVLFILVFSVAGLVMNNMIHTSLTNAKKMVSSESEALAKSVWSDLKSGRQSVMEFRSKENPEINIKAEIGNIAADNPIYASGALKFKDGDKALSIRTFYRGTKIVIDSVYLVNPLRSTVLLISETAASAKELK